MILAIAIDDWKILAGICVLVLGGLTTNAIRFIQEWSSARRDDLAEQQKQEYFRRIADGQDKLADSFQNLSIDMRAAIRVGDDRHRENLDRMGTICKATCHNYKPIHQHEQERGD